MIIDCGTCVARDHACGDCMVTVLLGPPGAEADGPVVLASVGPPASATVRRTARVELQDPEWQALRALAGGGLVPPLRLVQGADQGTGDGTSDSGAVRGDSGGTTGARKRRSTA